MDQRKNNNAYMTLKGEKIKNIKQFINDFLQQNPDSQVHIGTDSQDNGKKIDYVVSIVLYRIGQGGIIINKRERMGEFKNNFYRLWTELEKSLEVAEEIGQNATIHLDFNPEKNTSSNAIYASGVGYIKSFGYNVVVKPDAWAASKVADRFCRNKK